MVRRKIALITAQFPPSNLVGVHRMRLWAQHIHEFGWDPIILTTHHRHYEEALDWELAALVDPSVRVITTRALPTKPVRLFGDIGLRGLPFHIAALRRLAGRETIDFALVTIPANHSALLGRMLKASHGIPYGIDYMDPWVGYYSKSYPVWTKHHWVRRVAPALESWAVRESSLICGVTEKSFDGVLQRNPEVAERVVTAAMPLGNSEADYRNVSDDPSKLFLFDPRDGKFHFTYAGAMLPRAYDVLDIFLRALAQLRTTQPAIFERIKVHFVGTGKSPNDPESFNIRPHAERYQLCGCVDEQPQRIGFVDVLRHLSASSAILVLGSTEPHYTPSKIYQSVQSRRPVFGMMHEKSTAVGVVETTGAGTVVRLTEARLPEPEAVAETLAQFVQNPGYDANRVDWSAFEAFSARASTKTLMDAVDRAYAQSKGG